MHPDATNDEVGDAGSEALLLQRAAAHARRWRSTVGSRSIPAAASPEAVRSALGETLPEDGEPADAVLDRLVAAVEPGLLAIDSPRFYGWVMGGVHPVALAADWLVSAWDQNGGMRDVTPGVAAAEEIAGEWVVDLLGLPRDSTVGFATGATMSQFAAMAAGRDEVLHRIGWDAATDGLAGAPPVRFVVGRERHGTIDLAGRYLGLGAPMEVPSDEQGRIDVDGLADLLAEGTGPALVVLQAGNIHSGAFDDFARAIPIAHEAGAWVHVDGAFGLWAAASPRFASLTDGLAAADSWSTDAHKTLNVPYDCGIAIVRDREAMQRALSLHASYLHAAEGGVDPHEKVAELSRRARGVPTWAVLRTSGRRGVRAAVEQLADSAGAIGEGLGSLPGVEVLNDVVFTQVSVAFADDAETEQVSDRLRAGGEVLALTSRWRGRRVVRFSVSNRGTDAAAAARTVEAVRVALEHVRSGA